MKKALLRISGLFSSSCHCPPSPPCVHARTRTHTQFCLLFSIQEECLVVHKIQDTVSINEESSGTLKTNYLKDIFLGHKLSWLKKPHFFRCNTHLYFSRPHKPTSKNASINHQVLSKERGSRSTTASENSSLQSCLNRVPDGKYTVHATGDAGCGLITLFATVIVYVYITAFQKSNFLHTNKSK